jgi:hypothetical protein
VRFGSGAPNLPQKRCTQARITCLNKLIMLTSSDANKVSFRLTFPRNPAGVAFGRFRADSGGSGFTAFTVIFAEH